MRASQRGRMKLLLLLLLNIAWVASAQSDLQIVYSPMVLELAGERGARVPFEITVLNTAQFATAHFRADVTGLEERRDGVYQIRRDDEWEFSASTWIELDETEFAVAPGGFHVIRGHVQIPRRASGSGYATVVTELVPESKPADVEAATSYYQQFQTALEIIVGRQHKKSAYISELSVVATGSRPELAIPYGSDAMLFMAAVHNDGDVHVRGRGQLIIRDPMGRRVRSVPLGSGRGVIIPGATLDFGSIIRGLTPGKYEMEVRIDYGGHRPAVNRTTFEMGDDEAGISGMVAGRAMRVDATPSLIDLSLIRQGYRAATITVSNFDTSDVRFKVFAEELAHDADGVPVRVDPDIVLPHSARSWIEIRPDDFVLRPGQRRNIVVGFQVPEGQNGGRYARIRIQAEPADVSDESEINTIVTDLDVATHLTLGMDHKHLIEMVDVQWQQIPNTANVVFGISVGNVGNIHSPISGRFTLLKHSPATEEIVDDVIIQSDERWDAIEQLPAEVSDMPLLPGEIRFIQTAFTTPFEPLNQYQVVVELPQGEGPPRSYRIDLWVDAAGIIKSGTLSEALDDTLR